MLILRSGIRVGEMIVIVIGKERERVEPDRGDRNPARCVLNDGDTDVKRKVI
jgi:hypothetical protein